MKYIFDDFVIQRVGKPGEKMSGEPHTSYPVKFQKYTISPKRIVTPIELYEVMRELLGYEYKEIWGLSRSWGGLPHKHKFEVEFLQSEIKADVVRNKYGKEK